MNSPLTSTHSGDANQFQSMASVGLSTLTGVLIALPASFISPPPFSTFLPLVGAIVGGRIGYLRRRTRAYFYFVFLVTLVLLSVVSTASFQFP